MLLVHDERPAAGRRLPVHTPHPVSGVSTPKVRITDPLWNWGSGPLVNGVRAQVTGDLWLPQTPDVVRCPFHYVQWLTRIVYWYSQGESVDQIGERVTAFHTAWGVERSLKVACRRIADCLNEHPERYGVHV